MNLLKIFFIHIIFIQIKLSLNEEINISATNEVTTKCNNGLYFVQIKAEFSSSFDKFYSFPLSLESPPEIKLKCFLAYQNKSIICFANLNSNKFELEIGEFIKIPQNFPKIENINWDYDSFVKNIYEKEWMIEDDCLERSYDNYFNHEWGLVFDIKDIYENKCSYSIDVVENKYIFKMKAILLAENLKKKHNISIEDNLEFEFLQEIWIPILINVRKGKYKKINDFSFAFCSLEEKMNIINLNYLKNEELDFDCYITIPEGKMLIGAIKVEPFYDYLYIKLKKNNKVILDNIYFNINTTIEEFYNVSNKPFFFQKHNSRIFNLRNNEEIDNLNYYIDNNITNSSIIINNINKEDDKKENEKNKNNSTNNNRTSSYNDTKVDPNKVNSTNRNDSKKDIDRKENENSEIKNNITENSNNTKQNENNNKSNTNINGINNNNTNKIIKNVNYFIIGGEKKKIYCPDRPIFIISDSSKDILLFSSHEKEYTLLLKGILTNGLQELDNNYFSIMEIYEDISFSLHIIDNLAENEDDQKAEANCTIPAGTLFYRKISIFCHAEKISEESKLTNDTDITLNWGLEKNRLNEEIIIKWPNDKKKKKHIYSYYIQGFSLVQTNYGCFNNEFYFYIYIYNLNQETDIKFEIQMKNPTEPKAICKLHESFALKCYLPLYKHKLEQYTQIDLPTNYTYYSVDEDGNKVTFMVDEYDSDYDDFHITVKEECGDYFIVGALKKAGLDYFKIFIIIIGILVFAFIVFICFICYIYYKIRYRNRKGVYIRHIEEGINTDNNINDDNKGKKMEIISSRK